MNDILITIALPEENFLDDENDLHLITTGLGKSRSMYALTKALHDHSFNGVINIGTAGSARWDIGDIIVSYSFVDRDLAACSLATSICRQKFDRWLDIPSIINKIECLDNFVVSTGDSFVTSSLNIEEDAVDMEAFAQAMVCHEENVPFLSVKYITDKIGNNSIKSWSERLCEARISLRNYFEKYISMADIINAKLYM